MPARDKIYIAKDDIVQGIYERLTTEKGDSASKPFRFDRDVFLAATVVGYNAGASLSLEKSGRKEKFNWSTLENDENALTVLRSIALLSTKDPGVLIDDEQVVCIAEGFANAGIHILGKRLGGENLDELHEAAIYMIEQLAGLT